MARDQLAEIAEALISEGYAENTPVCLMESVSLPTERSFACTLNELRLGDVHNYFLDKQPVLVMVGEVYRKKLQTLKPLIESQINFNVFQEAS
jgi:uroporphyrin-III C-methyltransferase